MPETPKLVLALVIFFVVGIFLTLFHTDILSRMVGILALAMSGFGVVAVWLKSHGKTLLDLTMRPKIKQNSKDRSGTSELSSASMPNAQLSKKSLQQLDRALSALKSFGFFSPECPTSDMLVEALADYGEPITLDAVFVALEEANHYHHDFEMSRYDANFTFLPSKTEQFQKTIEAQVQAILEICRPEIVFANLVVGVAVDHKVQIFVDLNGERFECRYQGAEKYLSTAPFVALAKHLHKVDDTRRLACLWTDQGAYVSRITIGTLGAFNKALGKALTLNGNFIWLDEEEGFDADTTRTLAKP